MVFSRLATCLGRVRGLGAYRTRCTTTSTKTRTRAERLSLAFVLALALWVVPELGRRGALATVTHDRRVLGPVTLGWPAMLTIREQHQCGR